MRILSKGLEQLVSVFFLRFVSSIRRFRLRLLNLWLFLTGRDVLRGRLVVGGSWFGDFEAFRLFGMIVTALCLGGDLGISGVDLVALGMLDVLDVLMFG